MKNLDLPLFPFSGQSHNTVVSEPKHLLATSRAHFPISNSDVELLSGHVDLCESDGNLDGNFEVDLQKLFASPQLTKLLRDYQEVFGTFPTSGKGVKTVTMDIEIRE